LTARTKEEVSVILDAGDSGFRPASKTPEDVRAAFRKAATWADWVKDHNDGDFEGMLTEWNAKFQPGYMADDPDREAHRCRRWHYYDLPIRYKGDKPGVEPSNALTALSVAVSEFERLAAGSKPDRKVECWWLYWLCHVVGDLHQPLHCASNFERDAAGDAGGNKFKLDGVGSARNLHALWDAGIDDAVASETDGPSDVESVTSRWSETYAPGKEDAADLDVASWIAAGAKRADEAVYVGVETGGRPSVEYRGKLVELCKRQAVLAGFRLAALLNQAFD
jgi:hypothetical protein